MSTPSLSVPSKAALHALRGLALGTSCAIGLIVEDRRRRISTLSTAVSNKKKLRSSRQYHGSAEASEAVRRKEDDGGVLSGEALHWHLQQARPKIPTEHHSPSPPPPQDIAANNPVQVEHKLDNEFARPVNSPDETTTDHWPTPRVKRMSRPPQMPAFENAFRPAVTATVLRGGGDWARELSPDNGLIARAKVGNPPYGRFLTAADLLNATDLLGLDEARQTDYYNQFLDTCQEKSNRVDLGERWLDYSAALCKFCQSTGQWRKAQKLLLAVVQAGPLPEDQYYKHDPYAVIESVLSNIDTNLRLSSRNDADLAVNLLLPLFTESPRSHAKEFEQLSMKLIPLLFTLHKLPAVRLLYWRRVSLQEDATEFTAWTITSHFNYGDYKSVVKLFKLQFSKMASGIWDFKRIVEMVIKSVELMQGANARRAVLSLELSSDSAPRALEAAWLMRLLQSDWAHHKDATKSWDLFNEMVSLGLLDRVAWPEFVHKTMVQLTVLGGNYSLAFASRDEVIRKWPYMARDVGLNGYLALAKAKLGDWDGVLEVFKSMQPQREAQQSTYDHAFVPVLKVFAENRPIAEIEEFIIFYTTQMRVGIPRYMVTLVANKYGACHDLDSFVGWLQHCSSNGFTLDPSFCNAVLYNCRTKWNFPFRELRKLFWAMRKLDPTCVDSVTERIIHKAALMDGKSCNTPVRQRIRSLKISCASRPVSAFKSVNVRDVLEAMNEELVCGLPAKAVQIYKRAVQLGMPWCGRCFRVAITALLKQEGSHQGEALELIELAHREGHDVTAGVTVFLKSELEQFRAPFEEVISHLNSMVAQFESMGVLVDTTILTYTAIVSIKFGHHAKAISLCKLAMERASMTNPCFSTQSLRALLMAYWQTLDVGGIEWLIESLPSSPVGTDKKTLILLKETKRHLHKWKQTPRVLEVKALLDRGIEDARQRRLQRTKGGSIIYQETMRIMREAVADSGVMESAEEVLAA